MAHGLRVFKKFAKEQLASKPYHALSCHHKPTEGLERYGVRCDVVSTRIWVIVKDDVVDTGVGHSRYSAAYCRGYAVEFFYEEFIENF